MAMSKVGSSCPRSTGKDSLGPLWRFIAGHGRRTTVRVSGIALILGLTGVAFVGVSPVVQAASDKPTVTGFAASPSSLGSSGGSVSLSAEVTGATSCVFTSKPVIAGLPSTVPCSDGSVAQGVTVPGNSGKKAAKYTINLSVVGATTVKAKAVKVSVASGAGALHTWGTNSVGQLGLGTFTGPQDCEGDPCSSVPAAIGGLSGVAAFSAGNDFSLALLTNGTVWAWGGDEFNQLGNNSTPLADEDVPVQVMYSSGDPLTEVKAISAGTGYALALLTNDEVVGWGYNGQDQSSPNPTNSKGAPELVEYSGGTPLSGVTAIAAGQAASYALLSDGTVVAWGAAGNDELGFPTAVTVPEPVAVPGVSGVTAIAAGSATGFALLANGTVESWGFNNSYGVLGQGASPAGTPALVEETTSKGGSATLAGVKAISANRENAMALLSKGTIKSWGQGFYGEIGNGLEQDQDTAVSVTKASGANVASVVAISAGFYDALALLKSGAVMSWGDDVTGELGTGVEGGPSSPNPVQVIDLPAVKAISCGGGQSLAR